MSRMNQAGETSPLRKYRKLRGLTQAQLAELVGTTVVSISRWENGALPSSELRNKLCEVLKVKPEELWFKEDEQTSDARQEASEPLTAFWPPSIPDERYYRLPGREQDLDRLLSALRNSHGMPAIVIDGLGGLGKTSIATELARRVLREKLFEGMIGESAKQELFVSGEIVRVSDAALAFDDLLDAIARQLQLWELLTRQPAEKHAAIARFLRQHSYLVLVDNLETSENAQALVWRLHSLLGGSRAIITSRQQVRHDFVLPYSLKGLDKEDTLLFLQQDQQQRGGRQWHDLPEEKLIEIHSITGGAPLALKLVSAQTRFLDLDLVLHQLRRAGGQLYSFIFRQSWEHLTPTAQKVLIYIGSTAVTGIGWEELAATGIEESEESLLEAIDQLVSFSLLDISDQGGQIRYTTHQLTRQFVNSELPEIWREQGLL